MSGDWAIRRFQSDDLEKIAAFRRAFPERLPVNCGEAAYHRWKYLENPVRPGYVWLAEDGDSVIATAGMTPKKLRLLGRVVNAAELGDAYTLPDYQGRGIFTSLVKNTTAEVIESGIELIYGLPNQNALPGYRKKLDYEVIPSVRLCHMGRPLNMKRILNDRNPLLAAILAPVLGTGSRLILRLAAVGTAKSRISISEVSSFPDDIEKLWGCVSAHYDAIMVRSTEYLRWRYQKAPDSYIILIARNLEDEILGYIVGRVTEDGSRRIGFIADFLAAGDNDQDSGVFRRLALTLIEVFRRDRVDSVVAWAVQGSLYYRVFRRLGFLVYGDVPVICYKNEIGNRLLNGSYRWHFTLGDSDNI